MVVEDLRREVEGVPLFVLLFLLILLLFYLFFFFFSSLSSYFYARLRQTFRGSVRERVGGVTGDYSPELIGAGVATETRKFPSSPPPSFFVCRWSLHFSFPPSPLVPACTVTPRWSLWQRVFPMGGDRFSLAHCGATSSSHLSDTGDGNATYFQLQHILSLSLSFYQKRHRAAKEAYESLLQMEDLPAQVKATTLQQLGKAARQEDGH